MAWASATLPSPGAPVTLAHRDQPANRRLARRRFGEDELNHLRRDVLGDRVGERRVAVRPGALRRLALRFAVAERRAVAILQLPGDGETGAAGRTRRVGGRDGEAIAGAVACDSVLAGMSASRGACAVAAASARAAGSGAPSTGSTTTPALSGGRSAGVLGRATSSAKGCGSGWQAAASKT